ncbi:carboxymuconolactone decarboxylase family protein [Lysobacter capsici]|uniref:carboxymuconolactone decarboxylase family protein n=1 Tax=Lysobacter capsici TaxID=435897 RepID=UPI001BFFDF43|nr:carboxymuconolactone decarboxylase family protein [Lysobacter capsici]QWF16446.1 carboxymuconolactone decarboxylase family protein [Lysobacter capsici]
MSARLDYNAIDPQGTLAIAGLSHHVGKSSLEASLIDLVNVRVSQLNGCAYCIRLHTEEAVERGESHRRLHLLRVWPEGPFTERERAALAWADAITLVNQAPVSDEVYAQARAQFSDADLVALTHAAIAMNAWNRLGIAFRKPDPALAG